MTFNALVVEKTDDAKLSVAVKQLTENRLPEGNVTVSVKYSTVNYKDGLCLQPNNGLVRTYPNTYRLCFARPSIPINLGRFSRVTRCSSVRQDAPICLERDRPMNSLSRFMKPSTTSI